MSKLQDTQIFMDYYMKTRCKQVMITKNTTVCHMIIGARNSFDTVWGVSHEKHFARRVEPHRTGAELLGGYVHSAPFLAGGVGVSDRSVFAIFRIHALRIPLPAEKVGMSTRAGSGQYQRVLKNLVDQKPISLYVAFAKIE